jgi:ABC-type transporter lipoprotein component MlaA
MSFFGKYEVRFNTVVDGIMTLFQMMFGKFFYGEMEQANVTLAPVFFYPFIVTFNFIVLSFFSAIIMRTYDNLRQRKQLVTEAMAMILTKETQKQKAIWINLICCRIK